MPSATPSPASRSLPTPTAADTSTAARTPPGDSAPQNPPGTSAPRSLPGAPIPGTPAPTRLHHLDAVRAGALLLGLVLHSLLPFEPDGIWLFEDSREAGWTSVAIFVIHLFRMALFMMLAGYFGRMVLQRRGPGAFLRDRGKRLALPLVVFAPLTLIAITAVAIGGTVLGLVPAQDPEAAAATAEEAGLPTGGVLAMLNPAHLWFLLVLIEAVVVTVVVRAVLRRILGADRAGAWSEWIGAVLASPVGLLVAALPYALGILAQGVAMFGILQPTTVLPELAPTLAYFGAFLVGWFLHARAGAISRVGSRWAWMLPAAVALTVLAFVTGWFAMDGGTGMLLVAAATQGLAAWAWVFSLTGLAQKLLSAESPVVRYLADSSYWIYILHLPLLLAVGMLLAPYDLPIVVKLLITWTLSMTILLLSYDLLVRSTWIGAWLNGRRRPRALLPGARTAGARRHATKDRRRAAATGRGGEG